MLFDTLHCEALPPQYTHLRYSYTIYFIYLQISIFCRWNHSLKQQLLRQRLPPIKNKEATLTPHKDSV